MGGQALAQIYSDIIRHTWDSEGRLVRRSYGTMEWVTVDMGFTSFTRQEYRESRRVDYLGELVLEDGKVYRRLHEAGWTDGEGREVAAVRDWRGSLRATWTDTGEGGDKVFDNLTGYYPYGLPWADWQGSERWLYGGKELEREHGLWTYDFHAREQDPALGRFRTPDPLADRYKHLNPYLYAAANPVSYTDPTGCYLEGEHKKTASTYMDKADFLEPIKMNISEREQRERSHQLQKTKDDYQKMIDDQFIEYRFYPCESNNGKQETRFACDENGTRILNGNGNPILEMFCDFRETGSVFHESRHGGQFARGEVGYDDDSRQVTGFGIAQEVDAYKAQYSAITMMSLPIAVPAPFKLSSPLLSSPVILRIPGINGYELLNKSIDSYDEITPDLIRSIYERQGNQYQFIYDSLK